MILPAIASFLPAAIGAVAIAAALYERARFVSAAPASESTSIIDASGAASAALCALALYLLTVGGNADRHALVLAASFAGAVWLAGRVHVDARLFPAFLCAAGLVLGAYPMLGLALVPLVAQGLVAQARGALRLRGQLVVRSGLVLLAGALLAAICFGTGPWRRGIVLPTVPAALAWYGAAARVVGPAALALALAGYALALVGDPRRANLALVGLLALAAEVPSQAAGPITALALALGIGLLLLAVGARLGSSPRSAQLALAPLALVILLEPLSLRIATAHFTAPSFGPVPPPESSLPARGTAPPVPHPRAPAPQKR